MTTVLTYGTFDLFHIGHVLLLERARSMGDKLIVGVSTDEFNSIKGKKSVFCYEDRARIVSNSRSVDLVIPESDWAQKASDIQKYGVDVLVMGDDWKGKFDDFKALCRVEYLTRTDGISSSLIKNGLAHLDPTMMQNLKQAVEAANAIVKALG